MTVLNYSQNEASEWHTFITIMMKLSFQDMQKNYLLFDKAMTLVHPLLTPSPNPFPCNYPSSFLYTSTYIHV